MHGTAHVIRSAAHIPVMPQLVYAPAFSFGACLCIVFDSIAMADTALVEETEKRLRSHKGVQGFLVLNGDGIAIRSTMDNAQTVQYAALVSRYVEKTRTYVKKLDGDDELDCIRIRCTKYEIVIAPDFTGGTDYHLVVVQNPTTE